MTTYIFALICFAIIGICVLAALHISRKPCHQCKHWVQDINNHMVGECRLAWIKRETNYDRLAALGLLSNAEDYYHSTAVDRHELDGCSKFEKRFL